MYSNALSPIRTLISTMRVVKAGTTEFPSAGEVNAQAVASVHPVPSLGHTSISLRRFSVRTSPEDRVETAVSPSSSGIVVGFARTGSAGTNLSWRTSRLG